MVTFETLVELLAATVQNGVIGNRQPEFCRLWTTPWPKTKLSNRCQYSSLSALADGVGRRDGHE